MVKAQITYYLFVTTGACMQTSATEVNQVGLNTLFDPVIPISYFNFIVFYTCNIIESVDSISRDGPDML